MLAVFEPGCPGPTESIQTLAEWELRVIREDRKLTFSEFPSNPADVIRSPTLESVRTNFPGMRLAFGCSKLLSAARSAVYTDCHACSGLSCRLLIRAAR